MSIIRLFGLFVIFSLVSACATTKSRSPTPLAATASQPVVLSDSELGLKYLLGKGVVRDETKAFYHFQRAANQGDVFAQNEVAYLYAAGKGVPQDYAKALQYYQQAAHQNLASAEYSVGLFYLHGLSVPVNQEMARVWLQKAAGHGFEPAVSLLRQLGTGQTQ